jgi:hypothetical protein
MSQGRTANRTGNSFRNVCCSVLRQFEIAFCPEFETNVTGVMGKKVKVDIHITRAIDFEEGLYVECRYQRTSGSAEDKSPCLLENICERYDRPTIVVTDGASSGKIREYLDARVGGNFRGVLSLSQFFEFAEKVSLGLGEQYIQEAFDPDQMRLFA